MNPTDYIIWAYFKKNGLLFKYYYIVSEVNFEDAIRATHMIRVTRGDFKITPILCLVPTKPIEEL